MRRRLSSAAFPLHRHSLPQLAMDGVMVALAYELAYRLRFDAGMPHRYHLLLTRTIIWTVAASIAVFVLFRLYQKWWRYVTGRDYVSIAQAIVIATLSLPAFVATTHPVKVRSEQGFTTVNIPLGVLVLFFLLTLTMVAGSRFAARLIHDPRARRFRPRQDARRILPAGAGSIPVRTLPTVFELLQGGGNFVRQVRGIRVEDVLGREPVRMELDRVGSYLNGEVVMVTGAGGSIGAELSRQIARVAPRRLILLDHAEDNLFRIQRELEDDRHVHPSVLSAVLADCKEGERMREVFAEYRPTIVFHAAAYKHVGLMELNPVEAVRNNALATRLCARVAGEQGVGRFVLVSTDKAVSPATVMGASTALADWAVEAAQQRWPKTTFATVRFGNVLGSSGSVVPIFRRQIGLGGPVTVTDERMKRYFMTIPEAVDRKSTRLNSR